VIDFIWEKKFMNAISTFASFLADLLEKNPAAARQVLAAGYRAFLAYGKVYGNRKLSPARRYASDEVMKCIINALIKPEKSCMASLFVPGELLAAAGVNPYSVEALSSYLAGTHIEKVFLDVTVREGLPDTMCSFHRVFFGAAESGLLPMPPFVVYTNLACDSNMMTFPYLKEKHGMPAFYIDVPWEKNEESVQYVAGQLRDLRDFLEDMTKRTISDEALKVMVERSNVSAISYMKALSLGKTRALPSMMTTEMYGIFMSRIFSGTETEKHYADLFLSDMMRAPVSDRLRVNWVHVYPFMQPSLRKYLNFSPEIFLAANDLSCDGFRVVDSDDPFRGMAQRMVYSIFNGPAQDRADYNVHLAKKTDADGVVIFSHWGCRVTIGAAGLIRDALDDADIPAIILDGDGCNPGSTPDGQILTRTQAFTEMLQSRKKGKQ
jgi:benzoyl-CoA reductase/2-hydroxyglutaryl-CoA dehydratase subunit BcrC/BadD/HgdB